MSDAPPLDPKGRDWRRLRALIDAQIEAEQQALEHAPTWEAVRFTQGGIAKLRFVIALVEPPVRPAIPD